LIPLLNRFYTVYFSDRNAQGRNQYILFLDIDYIPITNCHINFMRVSRSLSLKIFDMKGSVLATYLDRDCNA